MTLLLLRRVETKTRRALRINQEVDDYASNWIKRGADDGCACAAVANRTSNNKSWCKYSAAAD